MTALWSLLGVPSGSKNWTSNVAAVVFAMLNTIGSSSEPMKQLPPSSGLTSLLITRLLDDLYWVMSFSRWQDDRYWPAFRDAMLREHPGLTEATLLRARDYNAQRYHFQGIGRYRPDDAIARRASEAGRRFGLEPDGAELAAEAIERASAGAAPPMAAPA